MTPNTLLFIVLGLLFAYVLHIKFSDSKKEKQAKKLSEEAENLKDFDEDFFKATQQGEPYLLFLSLASWSDVSFIRSILQASQIPTYCEGEHMNNIYGGIAGTQTAVVATKLYILAKDYDNASELIKDYIANKDIIIWPKTRPQEE